MRRSLLTRFFLLSVPPFVVLSAVGLFLFAEYAAKHTLSEVTSRVGSHAGRVAGLLTRAQAGRVGPSDILSTLLSDSAVQCAEVRLSADTTPLALAPRGIGCLGQKATHSLETPLAEPPGATLIVRFSTHEVIEERHARREFSLIIITAGFIIAAGSSAFGFRRSVGNPLKQLLTAMQDTTSTGRFSYVTPDRRDEIGIVGEAFNALQHELESKTERLTQALNRLELQNERFDAALANMPHGLCMFDSEDRLLVCNAHYVALYDLPNHLTEAGTRLEDILAFRAEAGNAPVDLHTYASQQVDLTANQATTAFDCLLQDGRTIRVSYKPMCGGGYVASHEDITESVRATAQIVHLAHHDVLTGLPNRALFRQRMDQALARVRRGEQFAVLCLDLDRFKAVNDTFGHSTGDILLQHVAGRLRECVRETDTIARLGGDEFVIIQVDISQNDQPAILARRIIDSVSAPYDLHGRRVAIGTSVGIAMSPHDSSDCDSLLKAADKALYAAKAGGRGTFRFLNAEIEQDTQQGGVLAPERNAA